MAYNTVEDDDYINAKKEAIMKNIEVLSNGLSRFEKVLNKLADTGITKGVTHASIIAFSVEVNKIYNEISGDGGVDYKDKVKMQADHFVTKIEQKGKYLYD